MPDIRTIITKGFISLAAMLLLTLGVAPVSTFACAAPDSSQPGVHTPSGSDSSTFTYQCDGQYAGEWTNAYYVYDPSTNARTPLYDLNYSYDCTTGVWTINSWDFSAAQNKYLLDRVTAPAPSNQATNCPTTAPALATTSATPNTTPATGNGSTGPGSTNTANLNATNNSNISNTTTATVNNGITSVADTGKAVVSYNTTGGNANSGNAIDEANVINLLQSSTNMLGNGRQVATFTTNINGDVNGDLLFDPSTLGNLQNASGTTNIANNLTVNNATAANLNNKLNLDASSGGATVSDNTTGGNATSGSAEAIANVMNYLNSAISSGQSFVGTININGNLNGDILLPANLIDQLLASNVPTVNVAVPAPGSTNTSNTTVNNNATINNTNNEGVNNTVNSAANSGAAGVSDNTSGGSATTGQATTNVTAFNLTGSNVIGQNDILVFVNVVGKWVGMIVNAPAGATAAALGGGITRNTTINNNATINNTNNFGINNDIKVAATSGNAMVSDNTRGGNARSGNAGTAVNLLNVEGSTLDLSNWFGILFINVFGSWHGSFGINTSAGDPVASFNPTNLSSNTASSGASLPPQVFRFVPSSSGSGGSFTATNGAGTITASNIATPQAAVLAATTAKALAPTPPLAAASNRNLWLPIALIGGLTLAFILSDVIISHRRKV